MKKSYNHTREIKKVSFNKDREKKLLEFAKSVDFSKTVKVLLVESLEFKLMSGGFLSGKDALRALSDGLVVVHVAKGYEKYGDDLWSTPLMTRNLTIHDFFSGSWVFKLSETE